jgi:alkylated DNA repair dioxygenase AlkB
MDYIPNFLTEQDHERIWNILYSHSWSTTIHRRQQFYGETYYHTTQDIAAIQPTTTTETNLHHDLDQFDFITEKLIELGYFTKELPPTQILVNEYVGQMGIATHFDDEHAFGDTIVTLSLGTPVWMTLEYPRERTNQCQDLVGQTKVLLERNSLFCMRQDVRFKWRHGIPKKSKWVRLPNDVAFKRTQDNVRVSLTFRRLLPGRKRVQKDSTEWVSSTPTPKKIQK